jgi:hypothetical protein
MSREQPLFARGDYKFESDFSDLAHQYTAVKRVNSTTQSGTGMGKVTIDTCGAGEFALGIVQMNGAAGEAANVMVIGVSLTKISVNAAAGKAGDFLAVGDNGCLVKAASGDFALAVADEDYQPGDITTATVFPYGKLA